MLLWIKKRSPRKRPWAARGQETLQPRTRGPEARRTPIRLVKRRAGGLPQERPRYAARPFVLPLRILPDRAESDCRRKNPNETLTGALAAYRISPGRFFATGPLA